MFGKKKPPQSGGAPDAGQPDTEQPKKKGLLGRFGKKQQPAESKGDLLSDIGAEAARNKEDGDPLSFLGPSDNPDIVIKEITKNVGGEGTAADAGNDDLVQTVLDSAEQAQPAEAAAPESPQTTDDSVLPNAGELGQAGSAGMRGMLKKKQ